MAYEDKLVVELTVALARLFDYENIMTTEEEILVEVDPIVIRLSFEEWL